MSENSLISQVIMDELGGKNKAVHAYDRMIWTVRTGYLTLFFAGWGIFLKSLVETGTGKLSNQHDILIVMLIVSITLSFGGFLVDVNYLRRKFRVIYSLDKLLLKITQKGETIIANPKEIEKYLQVSGDKDDKNYKMVSGYRPALRAGLTIYLTPIIVGSIAVKVFW